MNKTFGTYKKPFVIAEAGCNHMGDPNLAREMIRTAARFCRADAIKFQKRNPKELLTREQYEAPHPVPYNSFGNTYGEHREFLELDIGTHAELKKLCEEEGITYACSVWDLTSAEEISHLKPSYIKIPSARNTNFELLRWLCRNFGGDIHLSLGMTNRAEEKEIITLFEKEGRIQDLVIYSCTSGYPVAFKDICLLEIRRLMEAYGSRVRDIGFSGHHLGIAADIAAYTLGAVFIERHFTLDRTYKGTDHAASLEPDGLRKLSRDLNAVRSALTYKDSEILPVEEEQRRKLKT